MAKKIIFFFIVFYILALIQTSFLVHFSLLGIIPNIVLVAVILINIFSPYFWQKAASSLIGGLYLDIFSFGNMAGFFGFYALTLLAFSFLLKIIFQKYVRFPVSRKI